jgi:branched-chain amino acid transport system ATP-binding protein
MTAATVPIISCRDVTKTFGALAAVKNLTFDVAEGETLGIGGPNGAGKTTLFEVISGMNPATSGVVRFAGEDITHYSPERICHRGVLRTFQLNAGFDSLTVAETALAAAQFGRRGRLWPGLAFDPAAREARDDALALVGLSRLKHAVTETLPVFERKLLMIASALAAKPRALLLDEPAGGLTPKEIDRVIEVVDAIKARRVTIVLIEHVMRFLVRLSSKVMIMDHGEKIYEGPPEGLARDAAVVEVYLGAGAAARLQSQFDRGAA